MFNSPSNSPIISIILPVYNGEPFINEAIESILNQVFKDFELIIVNDASTDNTEKIINEYAQKDNRIRIITNEVNKKLPASLNIGHKAARGKWLTWTSDDNIVRKKYLIELYNAILKSGADIVFSDFTILGFDNTTRKKISGPIENLLFGNTIGASFLYHKEVFEQLRGYDEELFSVEDYDFWLRAALNFKFHHLKKDLYIYRRHEGSISTSVNTKKRDFFIRQVNNMYKKLGIQLNLNDNTINFLSDIHLSHPIDIKNYVRNEHIIWNDLKHVTLNGISCCTLKKIRDLVKINWLKNKEQQSINTFLYALLYKPGIFLQIRNKRDIILSLKLLLKNII